KDFGVEYLENNCNKVKKVRFASWFGYTINTNSRRYGSISDMFQIYKLACEKALRRSAKSSSILQDAYEGFSKVPDLPEEQKKNLREIINLAYDQYETSPVISDLVKVLLEKSKSLNKREMMVSLPPIPADFQGNDEEFEDIYVMHRIIDSV
ncbi:9107_t:CDS:2, partial [Cetraspora pellucida]